MVTLEGSDFKTIKRQAVKTRECEGCFVAEDWGVSLITSVRVNVKKEPSSVRRYRFSSPMMVVSFCQLYLLKKARMWISVRRHSKISEKAKSKWRGRVSNPSHD